MKHIAVFVFALFLGVFSVEAQSYRLPQRGERGYSPPPRASVAVEPDKPDVNQLSLDKATFYKEMLGIDVFQKEVLRTYLKDYYSARVQIDFDSNLKYEDKQKLINVEQKKFEKSLNEVFTEEQVEQVLLEEQFGNRAKEAKKEAKKEKKRKKKKG